MRSRWAVGVLVAAALMCTGCGTSSSVAPKGGLPPLKSTGEAPVPKVSGDSGDPAAVAAVRGAVLPLLTARCRLERTEVPLVDAASRAAAYRAVDQRVVAEVSSVYAASQAAWAVAGVRSDMKALLPDPNYPPFSDCRLALDHWHGVQVSGQSAEVSVEAATSMPARRSAIGYSTTVGADGWASGGVRLINIRLVNEHSSWRLLQVTTLMPDGSSPSG